MIKRVILIGGPTASGKSTLALQLAKHLNGIIINADSMQLYQGLPLLTACPSPENYQAVPHFLYETNLPNDLFSAPLWAEKTANIIQQHPERFIIIVGGTGFYLKTLIEGIADIPHIPLDIRAQVAQEWHQKGALAFYEQLQKADPDTSAVLKPTDRQRLCRAWEILQHTGKPLGYWHRQERRQFLAQPFELVIVNPEKSWLYPIINQRVLKMLDTGALQEITTFLNTYGQIPNALSIALGVQEFSNYLNQEISLTQAIEKTQQRSRQYAKRQQTWFQHQFKHATFLHPTHIDQWCREKLEYFS